VAVGSITGVLYPSTDSGKTTTYASGEFGPAYFSHRSRQAENLTVVLPSASGCAARRINLLPSNGWLAV